MENTLQIPAQQSPFSTEATKRLVTFIFEKLPMWCIGISATIRGLIVILLAIHTGNAFRFLQDASIIFLVKWAFPVILEITFTIFSLISAGLRARGMDAWAWTFFGLTIAGFVYNTYHLLSFVDSYPALDPQQVSDLKVTLISANAVAVFLSEGGAFLLIPSAAAFMSMISQENPKTIERTNEQPDERTEEREEKPKEERKEEERKEESEGNKGARAKTQLEQDLEIEGLRNDIIEKHVKQSRFPSLRELAKKYSLLNQEGEPDQNRVARVQGKVLQQYEKSQKAKAAMEVEVQKPPYEPVMFG